VLEAKKYHYQKAISDLAGADIKNHKNDPILLIRVVRDWLVQEGRATPAPYSEIRARYEDFNAENFRKLKSKGYTARDIKQLPLNESKNQMDQWIRARKCL
jgi:hypothetical protein